MKRTTCLLTMLLASAQLVAADEQPPADEPDLGKYSVFYTGRLFGYFRYPEVQKLDDRRCPAVPELRKFPEPVESFDQVAQKLKPEGTAVRVAVGDNFAPFLLARSLRDRESGELLAKDEHVYAKEVWNFNEKVPEEANPKIWAGNGSIPVDNVGCFLQLMQFQAIVPGKHDFYFGPERLRQLAHFLAAGPTTGDTYRRVDMLGANLSLSSHRVIPDKPLPADDVSHEGYEVTAPKTLAGLAGVFPATPLPWMRQIKIQGALKVLTVMTPAGAYGRYLEELLGRAVLKRKGADALKALLADPAKHMGETAEVEAMVGTDTYTISVQRQLEAARICEGAPGHPNRLTVGAGTCQKQLTPEISEDQPFDTTVAYRIPAEGNRLNAFVLKPDQNYGLCFYEKDAAKKPFCQPFTIHAPFFSYPSKQLQTSDPQPYVLVGDKAPRVAIFGVVDPDLRQYIGAWNDSWLQAKENAKKSTDIDENLVTDVEVGDAAESLQQVLQFCNDRPDCKSARKILLAQMPRGKAAQLIAALGHTFDLVIAQTDTARTSGEQTLEKSVDLAEDEVNSVADPFVLVPGPHTGLRDSNQIRVRLQQAEVVVMKTGEASEMRKLVNRVSLAPKPEKGARISPLDAPELRDRDPKRSLFNRILSKAYVSDIPGFGPTGIAGPPPSSAERKSALEFLALKAMRDVCHADVAFLQHRDVFLAPDFEFDLNRPGLTDKGFQAAIRAIYWKGDFISCMRVTGDTIQKLLAQSKAFKSAESNAVLTELETGRDLAKLGIVADPVTADYMIGGQTLDTAKLYSIAVTDFLAAGDTGYPDLKGAEPGPPDLIGGQAELPRLASTILHFLNPDDHTKYTLSAGPYLDALQHRPADVARGLTPHRVFVDWWRHAFQTRITTSSAGGTEKNAQYRGVWYLNLDKFDAGYSLFLHSDSEAAVGQQFAGVTSASLTTAESRSLSFDYILRARHFGAHWDYFAESDLNFTHFAQRQKLTGQSGEPYQATQQANYWFQQTGWSLRLKPNVRNPWGWKLMLPAGMQTQMAPPFTQFTLASNELYTAKTTRSFYVSFRPAIRYENQKSWIEVGYQGGYVFRQPREYDFTNSNGTPTSCPISSVQSLKDCVQKDANLNRDSTLSVLTRSRFQQGAYLNFRMDMPLPFTTSEYVMENRGDFFLARANDSTVDTRFQDTWTHTLTVPIIGKLSLAPSLQIFFFENKRTQTPRMGGRLYYSYTTKVALSYNFEWHRGLNWKKALGFGNAVPTLAPLPAR